MPASDADDLSTTLQAARKALAGSAFFLAILGAVVAGFLIVAEPPGHVTRGEALAFGVLALLISGLWAFVGKGVLCGRTWALILAIILAVINILGAAINFIEGARTPAIIAFLLNAGIVTQVAQVEQLQRKRRWSLEAHPDLRLAVEQGDVAALVRVLRHGPHDGALAALHALGQMGQRAAAAVPDLIEVVLRKAPPEPWETDLCQLCRKKLTVWNRHLGKQLCGACANRIQARVDPSPAELAAKSLGLIGPPARRAIPVLERVCRSPDPQLRQAAGDALQRLQAHGGRDG